ncbi:hypothetical protein PSU4_27800 [Pseudonocardia sulfidoxydans NBRC 16205]|uniref:Uncharacterized protein n=1 Tax=Pseudonocardia sulfidoxydans NBRC 16205 TaxID=1223511 RepID=A0A511DGB3_9PSEU|nr:hypothetical protein PSU4_27800 [Pseudonocardia sulfidoxydans NBRC 16205]
MTSNQSRLRNVSDARATPLVIASSTLVVEVPTISVTRYTLLDMTDVSPNEPRAKRRDRPRGGVGQTVSGPGICPVTT